MFPKHVLKSEEGHTAIRYDAIEQEAKISAEKRAQGVDQVRLVF